MVKLMSEEEDPSTQDVPALASKMVIPPGGENKLSDERLKNDTGGALKDHTADADTPLKDDTDDASKSDARPIPKMLE